MLLKLPDFFYPAKVCELKPTGTDIDRFSLSLLNRY